MAHKKMKGRGTARGCSVKSSLKQAKREAKRSNASKGKRKVAAANSTEDGGEGDRSQRRATPSKLTKKELKLKALTEKQNRDLFPGQERVLLVGEGNFSFARALCQHLGSGTGIFATCLDSEETLRAKYHDVEDIKKDIEDRFGGTTLVGVDATRLHSVKEFRGAFSKVVWNFPHIGSGEMDIEKSCHEHRVLLGKFFRSATKCLDPDNPRSSIHVALKTGEPYKSWKVVQMAKCSAPLELRTVVPFAPGAWEGYAHRRTIGFKEDLSKDDSVELAKGANIYIFQRREEE